MSACGGSFACLARRSAFLGGLLGLSGWGGGRKWLAGLGERGVLPISEKVNLFPRSSLLVAVYSMCTYVQFAYCEKGTYVLRRPRGSRLLKDGGDTLDLILHSRMESRRGGKTSM